MYHFLYFNHVILLFFSIYIYNDIKMHIDIWNRWKKSSDTSDKSINYFCTIRNITSSDIIRIYVIAMHEMSPWIIAFLVVS